MSQQTNQGSSDQSSSDEIDLREVFKAIGHFFYKIGSGIVNLILAIRRATRKYFVLIFATLFIFCTLGGLWYGMDKTYFSSSIVIESEYYDRDLMDGAINELNSLAEQQAYNALGKKLNISKKEAANIRSLHLEVVMAEDDRLLLDTYLKSLAENKMTVEELVNVREKLIRNNAKYRITVEVFSNDLLEHLQVGLIHYLEDNDYVERRLAVEKANLNALLSKLQQERGKLDVLKGLIAESFSRQSENARTGSNNVIFGSAETATDPLNVYREDIKLYHQEQQINKKLALIENVEVIKSFTAFKKPANHSLIKILLFSFFIGLCAAYGLVLLLEANKSLNRYEQQEKEKKAQVA